jgi:hypothetical protein
MLHTATSDSNSALHQDLENILEKIESRTAAGEFTPNTNPSSAHASIADVEKAEETSGDQPVTQRPTGVRVQLLTFFVLISSGSLS